MPVDFGRTASDYARHRAGFPDLFFERLFQGGAVARSDRVLDLGTGTGTLARGLALRGCSVTGLDPSAALMEQAAALDHAAGVTVRYVEAKAEETGLPERSFEVVAAGQCWHWFDRPCAAAEARRLLVPGGRLLLAHFDWLALRHNVVAATEALILKHNPAWAFGGTCAPYPRHFTDLREGGFDGLESFTFDCDVPYAHDAWLGRIRASAGIGASLPQAAIARFDQEHREMLRRDFPADPLTVPHRVFALYGRAPG